MNKLIAEIQNYLLNNSNKIKIYSIDIIKGDVFCALKGKNTMNIMYLKFFIITYHDFIKFFFIFNYTTNRINRSF